MMTIETQNVLFVKSSKLSEYSYIKCIITLKGTQFIAG